MQFRFEFFSEDFVVDNLSDGTEYSTYIRIEGTDIHIHYNHYASTIIIVNF
jgi:hypothetical protein